MKMEIDSIEYLNSKFNSDKFEKEFPNFRRKTEGGLFVSHVGIDFEWIKRNLLFPVISKHFQSDNCFIHNKLSGGGKTYVKTVQAALNYCRTFLVVVSENSIRNKWVGAEVDWAIKHKIPMVVCLKDGTCSGKMHSELVQGKIPIIMKKSKWFINYNLPDISVAQGRLDKVLKNRILSKDIT